MDCSMLLLKVTFCNDKIQCSFTWRAASANWRKPWMPVWGFIYGEAWYFPPLCRLISASHAQDCNAKSTKEGNVVFGGRLRKSGRAHSAPCSFSHQFFKILFLQKPNPYGLKSCNTRFLTILFDSAEIDFETFPRMLSQRWNRFLIRSASDEIIF